MSNPGAFEIEPVQQLVERLGAQSCASELHGLMTGYQSAHGKSNTAECLNLYHEWLGVPDSKVEMLVLDALYAATDESLQDFSDFEFRVLLPADERPISERSAALSKWCAGYLSGFGSAGQYQANELEAEVAEALADFSRIATMVSDVPESEENEADFMEICEYVRVSVLLIFTECAASRRPAAGQVH